MDRYDRPLFDTLNRIKEDRLRTAVESVVNRGVESFIKGCRPTPIESEFYSIPPNQDHIDEAVDMIILLSHRLGLAYSRLAMILGEVWHENGLENRQVRRVSTGVKPLPLIREGLGVRVRQRRRKAT